MVSYRTLWQAGTAEQTIEKSQFIAYAEPVSDRAAAEAFFDRIRTIHRDARHVVPAFILGEKGETKWASDDGEPQGTAGGPILKIIEGAGLTFVGLAVVRYFGGIKLGPGGLVRAYSGSARLALSAAPLARAVWLERWEVRIDYSAYQKLVQAAKTFRAELDEPIFLADVRLSLCYPPEQAQNLKDYLRDLTAGQLIDLGTSGEIRLLPE